MTSVYLTGIDLAEFRSFAGLHVALAPEPGVMIVHGSNGLGKSSLFDALEWALTGDIDHFRSATGYKNIGKYLRRWGASVGPTSAALTFSDGGRVERQIASVRAKDSSSSGSVEDVIAFLRAPEWTQPITALDRYLMLTHFLGQSTLSRLTHRPADERFAVLKEASQSAELETFGIALHGSGSNAAARAFNKRIEQLDREEADLRSLLDQEDALWQASQQAGALDDAQSSDLAQTILSVLDRAWRCLAAADVSVSPPAGIDSSVLQKEIERTQERARQRELELNRSRALRDQCERTIATRAEAAAAALEAEKAVSLATAAALEAKDEAAGRHARLNAALDALTGARRSHATLAELHQSLAALADIRSRLTAATEARSAARENLGRSEQRLQKIERRAQIISRLTDEISDLEKRLANGREMINRARQWLDRDQSIAANRNKLEDLEATHPGADDAVAAAEKRLTEARAFADRQAAELAGAKASFNVLTNAVTAIAGNLPDDLCECPVCATKFGDARALSERAATAAGRLAPLLVEKQDAARRAQVELDRTVASLQQSQAIRSQVQALRSQIELELVQNRDLLSNLGWQEPHTRQAITARLAEFERWFDALSRNHVRRQRWIARLAPDRDGLAHERRDALRQRDDARRNENATSRRVDDLLGEQEAGSRAFDARATSLIPGIEGISVTEIEAALARAGDVLEQAQETHEQALAEATEQDARVASLRATEASLIVSLRQWTERRDAAESSLAAQPTQWRSLGWPDQGPTEADLGAASQELIIARDAITEAEESLKRLRDGREAWSRQLAHRRALDRLCSTLDLAPNSGRDRATTTGRDRVQQTIQMASATRSAKDIASLTSADVVREAEEFNADYIEPLGKLTKQINQAILCDPRIGIELHVNKKKIEQSASRAGELPATLGPIDPILVHSEGQMAALAVSMLCAASLTYPWSRWRALVLDDPLQHNDAIHASAFADLIGNLVTARGYQILLSTHDLAQSEFLQRKFEARRIPCAALNLLGRGKGGVEWNFRESNAGSKPSAASA